MAEGPVDRAMRKARARVDDDEPKRRRDPRLFMAMAAAMLGLSVLIALFTVTRQRSTQNDVTADQTATIERLIDHIDRLDSQVEEAQARAVLAADLAAETKRLAQEAATLIAEVRDIALGVDSLLASEAESAANRGQLFAQALAELRAIIVAEIALADEQDRQRDADALRELQALLDANAARLEQLLADHAAGPPTTLAPPAPPPEPPPPTSTAPAPDPPPTAPPTTLAPNAGLLDPLL